MTIGTRSVLFGAHQFLIHPLMVALGWWTLYGIPLDPRLWVAFFVHDLGLMGKPDIDGEKGEQHPYRGAFLMARWFDKEHKPIARLLNRHFGKCPYHTNWYAFTVLHSRYLRNRQFPDMELSMLCFADKMAIVVEPWWLYLPRVWLTGELKLYMRTSQEASSREPVSSAESGMMRGAPREWFDGLKSYMLRWVQEHMDGAKDTWTKNRG